MQLEKLFKMQRKLDEHIETEHPQEVGEDRLAKKILALQVELGELAQNWRGFKFWSNNREPRIKDYKQIKCKWCNGSGDDGTGVCPDCRSSGDVYKEYNPLLEEYVDCLHFILSIGLEIGYNNFLSGLEFPNFKHQVEKKTIIETFNNTIHHANWLTEDDYYHELQRDFIDLGAMLGFTWEQIEQAYIDKNKVNHERQNNSY